MAEPQPAGARAAGRQGIAARVVRRDGGAGTWNSINVSEGGVFLAGSPLLDPGTDLRLGIVLPDRQEDEIVTQARVIWTNRPSDPGSNPALPAGMGIQFVGLDEESKRLLSGAPASEPSPQPTFPLGDDMEPGVCIGAYTIHGALGFGAMSTVYLAEHNQLGRRVALKRLHPRWGADSAAVQRFFDEGRLVNRVRHDHIVEVTDFISEGTDKYYVMELLEGVSLERMLADGPLPLVRAIDIAAQLSDALAAVHDAGIVHRDLKPANVMLVSKAGRYDWVKLLDFGVAKLGTQHSSLNLTAPGTVVGTPTYIAPEYSLGHKADHRGDLYSLGVIVFQLLTGRTPFETTSWAEMLIKNVRDEPAPPSSLAHIRLPLPLDTLVLDLLAKSPDERPANARDVAARLRAIAVHYGLVRPDPMAVNGPPSRPRRKLLAVALAAALAIATGVVIALSLNGKPSPTPSQRAAAESASVETPAVSQNPAPEATAEPTTSPEPTASPEPQPKAATEHPTLTPPKPRPRKRRSRKMYRRRTLDPFTD